MAIAFARTVILYSMIVVGLRFMGKRQIGELELSELVLALLIADLAAVPMQDFGIPLLNGLIPIFHPALPHYGHLCHDAQKYPYPVSGFWQTQHHCGKRAASPGGNAKKTESPSMNSMKNFASRG